MKKTIVFLLATAIIMGACGTQSTKENTSSENAIENVPHEHENASTGIVLNNGAKWKADSATNMNVQLLRDIVSTAKKENIEDYKQAADQLQNGLNKMVAECKMKGPDHEALHQWLEPLIEKVTDLKKSSTIEMAASIFSEIEKHVNLYTQYFE